MSERAIPSVRARLGARLRDVRKAKALSQEKLGQAAGLSGKFIGEVERGEKSIAVDSLVHVSRALEVTPEDLLRAVDGQKSNDAADEVHALLLSKPPVRIRRRNVLQVVRRLIA